MRITSKWNWVLVACLAAMTSVAYGQQETQPGARPGVQPGARPGAQPEAGASAQKNQEIAAAIYGCNLKEVEMIKLIQPKLQNPELKEFAAEMLKDHQEVINRFEKHAGQLAGVYKRAITAQGETGARPGDTGAKTLPGNGAAAAGRNAGLDWNQVNAQIFNKNLASVRELISKENPKDLGQVFLGMQTVGHMHMLDSLQVLQELASGELKQEIESSTKGVRQHLEHAKKLMEQLKDEPTERTTRRPQPQPGAQPQPRPE